jgi:branched-chain amino acid aminotransferase
MQAQRLVYVNGEYVPESKAAVSIFDSALMFGDMVFEMTRSFNGAHFKLREHLQRLDYSMRVLKIPLGLTIDDLQQLVAETDRRNEAAFAPGEEKRLMINVSRGPLSIYRSVFGGEIRPTLVISIFPLKWTVAPLAPLFDEGVHAYTPPQRMIPAQLLDPKVKNRSRLHYLMANLQVAALNDRHGWALLLDPDGFICEGTGANFFIVKDGRLLTPEPRNILRGISRQYVLDLAKELGLAAEERNLEVYDVITADEAFFTGTPFCILPCTQINTHVIGTGTVGPVTQLLLAEWSKRVGVDIVGQIRRWYKEMGDETYDLTNPYRFAAGEEGQAK